MTGETDDTSEVWKLQRVQVNGKVQSRRVRFDFYGSEIQKVKTVNSRRVRALVAYYAFCPNIKLIS